MGVQVPPPTPVLNRDNGAIVPLKWDSRSKDATISATQSSTAHAGPPDLENLRSLLREVDGRLAVIFHHRMIWQKTYGMLTANPVLPSPPYLFGVMT
ncbi:MAG: hypothetical protein ACLPYW_04160, partial [Acidimicrobiales bacterium]